MARAELRVGIKVDLATHPLTRAHGVGGRGVVTAVNPARVIVKTPNGGYLHCVREMP